MASNIYTREYVDGTKQIFQRGNQGRKPLPVEIKVKHKTISLNPNAHQMACGWQLIAGCDFSSWVEDMIYERIRIEIG